MDHRALNSALHRDRNCTARGGTLDRSHNFVYLAVCSATCSRRSSSMT